MRFPLEIAEGDACYVDEIVAVLSFHDPEVDILSSTKSIKNTLFNFSSSLLDAGGPHVEALMNYLQVEASSNTLKVRFKYANLNAPWGWKLAEWDQRGWTNMEYVAALRQLVGT